MGLRIVLIGQRRSLSITPVRYYPRLREQLPGSQDQTQETQEEFAIVILPSTSFQNMWHSVCSRTVWTNMQETKSVATDFKRGDHVEWNSEAGRVRGTIQ